MSTGAESVLGMSRCGGARPARRRARAAAAAAVVLAGLSLPAAAQTPARAPVQEVDPLTCWWRTSVSAVAVAQPFTLVLTCAVVDTETTVIAVDRARLDPRAIELAPFEVLGGSVSPDVHAGDRTFFQMEYRLRFVNEAFFNQDVALPALAVTYRIQTRGAAQEAATQGMERRFAMPHQTLRVTSLVPADAVDIRDASPVTFADLDARSSRGRLLTTSGLAVMALAAGLALLAVGRAFGARRTRPAAAAALLPEPTVLRHAARMLTAVRRQVDGAATWSDDDVAQALAATRVVAECVAGRAPSQRLADDTDAVAAGALGIRQRWGTGPLVVVSGSATARSLGLLLADQPANGKRLRALQEALTTFTTAQYREAGPLDEVALGHALTSVRAIARRLALERLWRLDRLRLRAWRRPMERPAP